MITEVDMHCHTKFSHDSATSISKLKEKLESKGIGVAITDHENIKGCKALLDQNPKVPVICGIEVTTKEGKDVLFYFKNYEDLQSFYEQVINPNKRKKKTNLFKMGTKIRFLELMNKTKNHDCLIALPHPFNTSNGFVPYLNKKDLMHTISNIDAIEVFNGESSKKKNTKSYLFAKKYKKIMIGGSDSHILETVGSVTTKIKKEENKHFLDALQDNFANVQGETRKFRQRTKTMRNILRNKFSFSD